MGKEISNVPNAFYDLIVFSSSSILFLTLFSWGIGWIDSSFISQVDIKNSIVILLGLFFFSYEYGRIAEAWSSTIVQKPLFWLQNNTRFLCNTDYLHNLDDVEEILGIECVSGSRKGGKWTVYFYAMTINPKLGTDLLKRYAWEKLARNSAFTFFILFIFSYTCFLLHNYCGFLLLNFGDWKFGSSQFTLILMAMIVLTYYDYYLRNCWNNDLT